MRSPCRTSCLLSGLSIRVIVRAFASYFVLGFIFFYDGLCRNTNPFLGEGEFRGYLPQQVCFYKQIFYLILGGICVSLARAMLFSTKERHRR